MTGFCLGWKIDDIQEKLVFATDAEFDLPNPEKYPEIVNQWWNDFFEYLNEYSGIDVWCIPEHIDSWFCDEAYAVGCYLDIGVNYAFGLDESGRLDELGPGDHEWITSMKGFVEDQKQKGYILPNPLIHVSGGGIEVGVHYLVDMIFMTLEEK